ncbi:hypothetical protein GCM10022206_06300 [Streptomyces chiangmaiensis]
MITNSCQVVDRFIEENPGYVLLIDSSTPAAGVTHEAERGRRVAQPPPGPPGPATISDRCLVHIKPLE